MKKLILLSTAIVLVVLLYSQSTKDYPFLPEDFPEIVVKSAYNPSDGFLFIASVGQYNTNRDDYVMILDNDLFPVFYRNTPLKGAIDFKKQPTGVLSYFDVQQDRFFILDSSYAVIDYYTAGDDFDTDGHELRINEDGTALLFSLEIETIDMSQIVAGGNPNADVSYGVVHKLDAYHNSLFKWNSLDYIPVTHADPQFVNLTAADIDYFHPNAIDIDYDGNYLISARHVSRIIKIDASNGDVIWQLGRDGDFDFIDDPDGISGQHSIRALGNNRYTLFDNGNGHSTQESSAKTYQLDLDNMTATLEKKYTTIPANYSWAMGHRQNLQNNNLLVTWSYEPTGNFLTEFTESGDIVYELTSPGQDFVPYRCFRFDWETNLFETNKEAITYNLVDYSGTPMEEKIVIYNTTDQQISFMDYYCPDPDFVVNSIFPIIIPTGDSAIVHVTYGATNMKLRSVPLALYSKGMTTYYALQTKCNIIDIITNAQNAEIFENNLAYSQADKSIQYSTNANARIHILSLSGQTYINENVHGTGRIYVPNLSPGIYIAHMSDNKSVNTIKFIVH